MVAKRLFAALFILLVSLSEAHADGTLLVCNKSDDTISFVDAVTLETRGVTTTGRGPHEVAVTPDGSLAFVANYEGPGNTISLVDVKAMKELRRIPIAPHNQPHGILINGTGTTVYATCEGSGSVIELDIATEKITRSFPTRSAVSHMLVLTPDEHKAYVANIGSGSVTVLDLVEGTIAAQVATGDGCEGIDITPDGREVWASNGRAENISVIDTATDKVIATLPCSGFPIRVKATPDGKRVFASCATANAVAVFDVENRKEVARIDTGRTPVGVLIDPSGGRAFIANTRANVVTILDLDRMKAVGTITAGNTPDGMAFVRGK